MNKEIKQAVLELWEELYDSANAINPDVIHRSMVMLMKEYNLEEFTEETDEDLLCVVHEKELYDANQKRYEIKMLLRNTLENY